MSGKTDLPAMNSFGDVVRWVVEELGAFCPSPERLAEYWRQPNAPQYRDIRYHVEEARCPICRAEQPEEKQNTGRAD